MTTQPVGLWIDWGIDGFAGTDDVTSRVMRVSWNRGGSTDLMSAAPVGSATITVRNDDHLFDPDNGDGALFDLLLPGRPVWVGINDDGTVVPYDGNVVHGLFAGFIREIAVQPLERTAEIICEDVFAWLNRTEVSLAASTTRSQAQFRAAVVAAVPLVGWIPTTITATANEPHGLNLSTVDTRNALSVLEDLNRATATRHACVPSNDRDTFWEYQSFDRWHNVGTLPIGQAIDAGADHVVGLDGWRISDATIVNVQRATVTPVTFPPGPAKVWTAPNTPFPSTIETIWADIGDYVLDPYAEITETLGPHAVSVTSLGTRAKIEATSLPSPGSIVTSLEVWGRKATRLDPVVLRAPAASTEPTASESAYGKRTGSDISGDLLANAESAQGLCDAIVWRYAQPKKMPTITLRGATVAQMTAPMYSAIDFTSSLLSGGERFEIVGISGNLSMATASACDLEVTWGLAEVPHLVGGETDFLTPFWLDVTETDAFGQLAS